MVLDVTTAHTKSMNIERMNANASIVVHLLMVAAAITVQPVSIATGMAITSVFGVALHQQAVDVTTAHQNT